MTQEETKDKIDKILMDYELGLDGENVVSGYFSHLAARKNILKLITTTKIRMIEQIQKSFDNDGFIVGNMLLSDMVNDSYEELTKLEKK